jgi:hypothetical protein
VAAARRADPNEFVTVSGSFANPRGRSWSYMRWLVVAASLLALLVLLLPVR